VKKFSKTKNGQQVYRTLHTLLLGGQRVVSTGRAIVTKLQSFKYKGDWKNFNFDKYVNLHIEQHNQHADLQEFGVAPLAKNLKTLWFQDGIKDPSLDAVKVSINANCANFTDFDSVKDACVEFKCTQNPTNDPRTRQVASVARGGRGCGSCPCKQDCRQRTQTSDKYHKRLVPQAEVDKQTHTVLRHYSDAKFDQLTPAEKQKLWQLRNAGKTPGTGPTRHDRRRAVASTLTSSTSSGSSGKRQVEDLAVKSNQPKDDQKWGRNRDNPALGRQVCPCGDDN
jgi:hypothetical protein